MADSFVFSIAEKLLGKLGSLAYQEVCLAWGVKNDLEKLEDTLTSIHSVLLDAEEKQVHVHELRNWLEKLKDACYDAEDVLDEFEVEALRRQVIDQQGIGRKVRRYFSCSNPVAFRFRMGHKIKKIMERFDEIAATKAKFNLTVRVDNREIVHREREMTHSFVIPSEVIGRDGDKQKIIELLRNSETSKDKTLSVIPIVGIGGIGKTALAKLVYNDEWANNNFQLKMWVCVSEDFDLKQVVLKILKSVTIENYSHLDVDQLIRILQQNLRGKKYLLILDDVWNEDPKKWIELKNVLIGGAHGSKIIVTTRSDKIASIMGTITTYKLSGLPREDCLHLFNKCAFREGEEKEHGSLMEIGKKIVEKCGGVPLAVKTLGSLLYSKTDEEFWKNVMESEIWNLEQNKDDILPALRLSYDHLPPYLKRCFVYCSFFPKDYIYVNFDIIQFWMAHGLLQSHYGNQEFENIGEQYIKELKSRSFFQDFETTGNFMYKFKMHDLIHDLATSLMKREYLMVKSSNQFFSRTIRHLSFVDSDVHKRDIQSFLSNLGQVRSINLFIIDEDEAKKSLLELCISRFKLLRVLNLNGAGIKVLLNKIANLKHLRYLNLSYNNEIEELPSSICKLQSLQCLYLMGCEELNEIPRDIRYLITLRLLWLTTKQTFLPKNGIGCLNSLRILGIANCKNLKYLFEDIGRLKVLRTLLIGGCPNLISLPHGIKYLSSLENLVLAECEKLNLDLSMGIESEDNHQDLNTPRLHLRVLDIEDLPQVVELPQWILQGSAGTLQRLYIEYCFNVKALPESMQDLKSLQFLQIVGCPKLSSLPKDMKCLNDLRELSIKDCPELSERCEQGTGEDWPKIAHVPKIILDEEIIKPGKN